MTFRETIVVLGDGDSTSRRVLDRLATRVGPARAGTPAFDWRRPDTWAPALDGARAVFVSSHPDLVVPGAAHALGTFADQAVEHGVRRIVVLSSRGEGAAELGEHALRRPDIEWTILRIGWLSQCFSEGFLHEEVLRGEVALPARPVGEPFVDADDIADVAVAVLTEDGHAGRVYELTGPRLLTFAEAIEEIAQATGRDIRYVRVCAQDYAARLAHEGAPADRVSRLEYLFGEVLDGRNARLTDAVARVLGREPRDFGEFARAAAAAGAWASRPARGYALPNAWELASERLELLEATYDPASFRRAAALGVGPGWRCLDAGAGRGSFARWLASRVGDGGSVVAADLDVRLLEGVDAPGLEVRQMNIVTDELPRAAYDLVHTRLVLIHLPERDEVLAKLAAAVRPGGVLMIEEDDIHPILGTADGAYLEAWQAFYAMMRQAGVDATWARRLPERLADVGLVDVDGEIALQYFRGGSDPARFWSLTWVQVREQIVGMGIPGEVVDRGRAALDDAARWYHGPATVIAWGRKRT